MFDTLIYIFLGFIGLSVGSFLNVIVFRFGFGESAQARSHCMACGAVLGPLDLIPVLSFFFLSGRCRTCGSRLSIQYPLVEILVALLFLASYAAFPPAPTVLAYGAFVALLAFLASLIALVTYDLRHTVVPMPFIYALMASACAATLLQSASARSFVPLLDSLAGGFALAAFFTLIYLVTRGRGMGLGDAYVAAASGVLLGLARGIEAVMFAFWIGTLVYLPIMLLSSLSKRIRLFRGMARVTMKTELPFVPFLALGVCLALFTPLSPLELGAWLANILWSLQH